MKIRWATFISNYIIQPTYYIYTKYYRGKIQLDCILEAQSMKTNAFIGALSGYVWYICFASFVYPDNSSYTRAYAQKLAEDVLQAMECDTIRVMPGIFLQRIKKEILSESLKAVDSK